MRFVSYTIEGVGSYGLLEGAAVRDFPSVARAANIDIPQSLIGLIELGDEGLGVARVLQAVAPDTHCMPLAELRLDAPIPRPKKNIFCVGRNYTDHVAEGYRSAGKEVQLPKAPQFFTKAPTCVLGPDRAFVLDPRITSKLDYEVELGVVIGTPGKNISRENAMAHVFGFTIINDLTARDLQRHHDQWFKGKSLDGSAPMGPAIVTLDELPELGSLELSAQVNGELRQRARVEQMIFDIPEIISQLSAGMTLEAGDIIATGTPSGVGYAMDPPRFLTGGDVVTCSITGIGMLRTTFMLDGDAR